MAVFTRRYALRDDQWEKIKDLLPGRSGTSGVRARDNRLFIDAILYRYRAGIPWRDLPNALEIFELFIPLIEDGVKACLGKHLQVFCRRGR